MCSRECHLIAKDRDACYDRVSLQRFLASLQLHCCPKRLLRCQPAKVKPLMPGRISQRQEWMTS